MFKWIARAIFILPPLAIGAGWFYLNYSWITDPHPGEPSFAHAMTALLDIIGFIALLVALAMHGDMIGDGIAWLWRRAEWTPRNARRY